MAIHIGAEILIANLIEYNNECKQNGVQLQNISSYYDELLNVLSENQNFKNEYFYFKINADYIEESVLQYQDSFQHGYKTILPTNNFSINRFKNLYPESLQPIFKEVAQNLKESM